jgi:hypothetical protein
MLRDLKTKLPIFIIALSVFTTSSHPILVCQTKPDTSSAGTWQGTLEGGGAKLRVVFHVSKTDSGKYSATFDSPDQNAFGIPFSSVAIANDSIHLVAGLIGSTYDGKFTPTKSAMMGVWRQHGGAAELKMERTTIASLVFEMKRPQEPKPPYPYKSEEVSFGSNLTGMKYTGTLTVPDSGGHFPATILITGSGVHDRNEDIFGHKPFLVLADYLTRRGIAVLRVDDRGVGGSTGNKMEAALLDHAEDVVAEIEFLKTRPEIDSNRIGLIGHSEGGIVAPIVAAKASNVAFVVLMAGPGVPGYQLILDQLILLDRVAGVSDSSTNIALKLEKKVLNIAMVEKDSVKAVDNLRTILETEAGEPAVAANAEISQLLSPSYRSLLSYDPRPTLEQVKCPVLALWGSKDLEIPPAENLPAVENALKKGGNKDFKVVEIPGLNHLFQDANTGSPNEYAQIKRTFSQDALKLIGDWIVEETGEK